MKAAFIFVMFVLSALLAGCAQAPPENVVVLENGDWVPEDGYGWVDVDDPSAGVAWTPGLESNDFPNVLASTTEGKWVPRIGYWWINNAAGSVVGEVAWDPGRLHPTFANIVTAAEEQNWIPLPGYKWSVMDRLSDGVWHPGLRHPQFQNVFAGSSEQTWIVPPGYRFAVTGQLSEGVWSPGVYHPTCPNVVASSTEGNWIPASGYTFANSDQSDLSVVSASQTGFEKFISVAVPLLVGAMAQEASQPQEGDALLDTAGRLAARKLAEASVDAAAGNLASIFPAKC